MTIHEMGERARTAAVEISKAQTAEKNNALKKIRGELAGARDRILKANARDIRAGEENGLGRALLDRLLLTEERIEEMARAIDKVVMLEDPVGSAISLVTRPNGLQIGKIRVPLGVIGIIYEARPNVTVDGAVLCLKSGNAVILRGGKEAIHSNREIASVMREALEKAGMNPDCIQLVEDTSRQSAVELMKLSALDILIPRGGKNLIRTVVEQAMVPVIETGAGNCHIYADEYCDDEKALAIIENAKVSRPSVCNAAEKLLVHRAVAQRLLPLVRERLALSGVKLLGCEETLRILGNGAERITEEDYATEFNDYILGIKIVSNIEDAVRHINKYSTHHSEAIVTENYTNAQRFLREVDSAAVYVNASTRFTDGAEFGLGAEIGISTQKLHARGPMGLCELTTSKYIVYGNGQIR